MRTICQPKLAPLNQERSTVPKPEPQDTDSSDKEQKNLTKYFCVLLKLPLLVAENLGKG